MDKLNIYFNVFYLRDKIYDPEVFKYFMQHTLILATTIVKYIIVDFEDTFATLPSSSY